MLKEQKDLFTTSAKYMRLYGYMRLYEYPCMISIQSPIH